MKTVEGSSSGFRFPKRRESWINSSSSCVKRKKAKTKPTKLRTLRARAESLAYEGLPDLEPVIRVAKTKGFLSQREVNSDSSDSEAEAGPTEVCELLRHLQVT